MKIPPIVTPPIPQTAGKAVSSAARTSTTQVNQNPLQHFASLLQQQPATQQLAGTTQLPTALQPLMQQLLRLFEQRNLTSAKTLQALIRAGLTFQPQQASGGMANFLPLMLASLAQSGISSQALQSVLQRLSKQQQRQLAEAKGNASELKNLAELGKKLANIANPLQKAQIANLQKQDPEVMYFCLPQHDEKQGLSQVEARLKRPDAERERPYWQLNLLLPIDAHQSLLAQVRVFANRHSEVQIYSENQTTLDKVEVYLAQLSQRLKEQGLMDLRVNAQLGRVPQSLLELDQGRVRISV